MNNDGRDDAVIMGASSEIYFSYETGFEMQPLQYIAGNVRIADLDKDGDMDIITFSDLYIKCAVYIYENLGNNVFNTVNTFYVPEGCSDFFITDFNNDSLPDALFLTYNFNERGCLLYYNQGDFQMGDSLEIELPFYGEMRRFIYCADMDGNGYIDIIISWQVFDIEYDHSTLEILFNDGHGNFDENPLTDAEEHHSRNNIVLKCYPNPFKSETTFQFTIIETSYVELSVYDLQGKLVISLTNKTMKGGKHQIKWGGLNNASQACKPGPYIAYLKVNGSFIQSIKLIKY